ncbi:hypothetical protein LXL04_020361 [Taraxacum kok-saghyz]
MLYGICYNVVQGKAIVGWFIDVAICYNVVGWKIAHHIWGSSLPGKLYTQQYGWLLYHFSWSYLIFTNFLSSAMIHATRPFVVNEWIKSKIEGYEVSGTVEHVGWSPTVIRGEDREAIHIPNHKFTMNVVRNMTQKTHWRIKTHLAIRDLDVNKINSIVADMRKVIAKNPQVEQQRLHRRVFLENVDPENQALLILILCFVKTSLFEEYLCVKVIKHFLNLYKFILRHLFGILQMYTLTFVLNTLVSKKFRKKKKKIGGPRTKWSFFM